MKFMSDRLLGDLYPADGVGPGAGELTDEDVGVYSDAVAMNNTRTIMAYNSETEEIEMVDVVNGALIPEQASVVSLHQNGYASDIDRRLLYNYIHLVEPRPATLTEYINQLDSTEIIPEPDPEVKTLDEYREDVTDNILSLQVYMADAMLELMNMKATGLNDMRAKVETLWGQAYNMDYDSIAQLDADMIAGRESTHSHAEDSGWTLLPPSILDNIVVIIGDANSGLNKAQCEEVRDKYWTPTAITFSDPPTTEEKNKLRTRIWSIPVESGVDFYDTYKNVSGGGGGGGDDPSESLVPADPETAPAASGGLLTFINSCQETYKTQFNNIINTNHPHQIITVKATGVDAVVSCYEVDNGAWQDVTNLTNITGKVGENGIHPLSEIQENKYSSRTPAGGWRLGNWSTCDDDIGAFGKESRSGIKINYKQLTSTMHWIDAGNSPQTQVDAYPSWYNTFFDTAQNPYHLIQWKRRDWESGTFYKSDKTTTVNGSTTTFEYGKYYANFAGVSSSATERLYDYVDNSYRNAIVIRFNMPPHVQQPVRPEDGAGAGSAYFLHSFDNDSTPHATGGCVSVSNANMIAILNWIDRTKSPFIFIGL